MIGSDEDDNIWISVENQGCSAINRMKEAAEPSARFRTAQCNPLLAEWEYVLAGLVCG